MSNTAETGEETFGNSAARTAGPPDCASGVQANDHSTSNSSSFARYCLHDLLQADGAGEDSPVGRCDIFLLVFFFFFFFF